MIILLTFRLVPVLSINEIEELEGGLVEEAPERVTGVPSGVSA